VNPHLSTLDSQLLEDVLASLEVSPATPGPGLLSALFARFNARVPFENATKIVRDAEIADPAAKPRTPDVFWREHLELGAGGTCFARVAAFDALLSSLGFSCRIALGRVREDFDHAALLVETAAGAVIADVGFPLPALLPARAGMAETPVHDLTVEETERGWRVTYDGGVPDGPRELEVFSAAVPPGELETRWRATFRSGSTFLTSVVLRVDRGERMLSFARGELRVDDRHTRLTLPLGPPRARALSEAFGVDEAILARALEIAGDPAPAAAAPTLTAYLETSAGADAAFEAIATSGGYRRLLEGLGSVDAEEQGAQAFRLSVRPEAPPGEGQAPSLSETVRVRRADRALDVVREGSGSRAAFTLRALQRDGQSWLVREAPVSLPAEALLRNDSLRGRLAGTFAADLLGWARLL
jgi:arylamine N-acetyltransferase